MTIRFSRFWIRITSFWYNLFYILWGSVSSQQFYQKVFLSYRGYGVKYLLNICIFSSMIFSGIFLHYAYNIEHYLKHDVYSSNAKAVATVLESLPTMNYNGKTIELPLQEPMIISSASGRQLLAIDLENQMPFTSKNKIPVILGKSNLMIQFIDHRGDVKNTIALEYRDIIGSKARIITQDLVKELLISMMSSVNRSIVYIFFPAMIFLLLFNSIMEKIVMVGIIFFFTQMGGLKVPIKNCIRVVLISSGAYILLEPLTLLDNVFIPYILMTIQTWCAILMISSLMKLLQIK